ncbi:hypothetical protein [Pseudalkalibacillus decolorationis]|uniref:hypothetical protein n=1 Tax=Pseudalkalibacillus decolorationis TaxID=163879 RepID=UPI002148D06A|nr:hypothetical protein [Pseudalkalibacillus decolorationis]
MSEKLTILKDKFQKGESDEEVEGLTIIIDGKIKEVFDEVINTQKEYSEYTEVMRDVVFTGLRSILDNK